MFDRTYLLFIKLNTSIIKEEFSSKCVHGWLFSKFIKTLNVPHTLITGSTKKLHGDLYVANIEN